MHAYQVSQEGDIFCLNLRGEWSLAQLKAPLESLLTQALPRQVECFFMDLSQAVFNETAASQYQFAYQILRQLNFKRHWKTALLISASESTLDFLETVTQNAGYQLRIFTEQTRAKNWLLAKQNQQAE